MIHSFKRIAARLAIGIAATITLVPTTFSQANAMDVYLFRGLAGVPFSVGLDTLEDKIKSSGIRAETLAHSQWQTVYKKIMARGTKQVAFVGHSMGALSAISLTKKLRGSGIQVAYLGLIDIPGVQTSTPQNAGWAENYISGQPGFGVLNRNARKNNLVINTRVPRTVHITIDDSERVHDAILSAVWLADSSKARNALAYAKPAKKPHAGLDLINTGSLQD